MTLYIMEYQTSESARVREKKKMSQIEIYEGCIWGSDRIAEGVAKIARHLLGAPIDTRGGCGCTAPIVRLPESLIGRISDLIQAELTENPAPVVPDEELVLPERWRKVNNWTVEPEDERPGISGKTDQCGYCHSPVGGTHGPDCPVPTRIVRMAFTVECDVEVACSQSRENLEFMYNCEGSYCGSNIADLIQRESEYLEEQGSCLCDRVSMRIVSEEPWIGSPLASLPIATMDARTGDVSLPEGLG